MIVLDDGVEHPLESRAILNPVVEDGRITRIEVVDGGSNYFPTSNTLVVTLDYNGTASGYGFQAGPIHTSDGIIDKVQVLEGGQNFVQSPQITVVGGGQDYAETEAIHLRVVSNVPKGVAGITLIANGIEQINRPPTQGGSGFADVVASDPYFDIFWVPDRDQNRAVVNGVGLWDLTVRVTDTANTSQISAPIQVRIVETEAPVVTLITPEKGHTNYVADPDSSISLVADAYDPDGSIRELQFLIDNKNTDADGNASFVVTSKPYILEWKPQTLGTYEIKVMAIDNAGVGALSETHTVTIKEPYGAKPIISWHAPEPINDRMFERSYESYDFFTGETFTYTYSYSYNGRSYVSDDVEFDSTVFLNVQAFDPPFMDINGSSIPGGIEKVTFWQQADSSGRPRIIGEAMNKYNSIYSIRWNPSEFGEILVWAEVLDLDGNVVRSPVRSFNVGRNKQKPPFLELVSIRQMGKGKYAARVNFGDFLTSNNVEYAYSLDEPYYDWNRWLQGEFSIDLLVNGVVLDRVDLTKLPEYVNLVRTTGQNQGGAFSSTQRVLVGEKFMQKIGGTDEQPELTYEFTDIVMEQAGSLEFSAVLMSRQGEDNYRKVALSDVKVIEINPNELFAPDLPNIFPEGSILSPRPSDLARATAVLTESTVTSLDDYGQIKYILMDNTGSGYDPENLPTVSIEGGGGQGAEAKVEVVDGAISDLLIEDFGINYSHDPENEVYDWIVKSDPNRSGEGFRAFVKISDGVLDEKQSLENGAILSTGIGYESILNKHGFVQIFDYNEGNGARGFVSKVNANGGITEITVTNGGESYNALDRNTSVIYILDSYNGVKHEGYGFLIAINLLLKVELSTAMRY